MSEHIASIQGYRFTRTELIAKGLSGDRKYYLETADGKRLLARISDSSEYERKKAAYELMLKASGIGLPMPVPVDFGYCEDRSEIHTLLTWVEGEDAERVLPKLSRQEQYRVGVEAGRILRRLHDNSEAACSESWQSRYFAVMEPRLDAYREEGVPFAGSDQILRYLESNRQFLCNRPQTLHHGDFHLGNMVIDKDRHLSVIDWDTADFDNVGDPWYEFRCIGTQRPEFAAGQIDGYFEKRVPEEFWRLLAFYQAGSAITSIVWAKYFAPECMDEIMQLNGDIVKWYDGMNRMIPTWYDAVLKERCGSY